MPRRTFVRQNGKKLTTSHHLQKVHGTVTGSSFSQKTVDFPPLLDVQMYKVHGAVARSTNGRGWEVLSSSDVQKVRAAVARNTIKVVKKELRVARRF